MVGIPTQEVLRLPFQATSTNEQLGEFSGIAATWNIDLQQSRFQHGAFIATVAEAQRKAKARNGTVLFVLCWQHNKTDAGPIGGITSAVETDRGLEVTGFIDLTTKQGQRAYSGLKKGYLGDLSVAFYSRKSHYEGSVRVISEVELIEISIVTFGAQPGARVTDVKTLDIRDIELRMERLLAQLRFQEKRSTKMNDDDIKYGRPALPASGSESDFRRAWNEQAGEPQPYSVEPGIAEESPAEFERHWRQELREEDDCWQLGDENRMKELQRRENERRETQVKQHQALLAERKAHNEWQERMKAPVHNPETFSAATGIALAWVRAWFSRYIEAGMVEPVDRDTLALRNEDVRRMANRDAESLEFQTIAARNKRRQGRG